jgi:hypothetical protein
MCHVSGKVQLSGYYHVVACLAAYNGLANRAIFANVKATSVALILLIGAM